MMKLSRGALATLAAAVAIPAGVAIAKTMDQGGWHRMSPETRQRLDEGKLAMARTALKLNGDQEKLWSAVETELRNTFKARADKRAESGKTREERQKDRAEGKKPDLSERFERMSKTMSDRAERMKSFTLAFKPFYASLSDEQKEVLKPLMRDLTPGMGRGHGGHGGRWAFSGGWGEGKGWGHHEGRGKRGGHHHGERGGAGEDGGAGGGRGDDAKPAAPQNAPDGPEGDEGPGAPDNQ